MLKLSVLFIFISTTLYSRKFNEIKGIWTIENPKEKTYFLYIHFKTDSSLTFKMNTVKNPVNTKYSLKNNKLNVGDFGYYIQKIDNKIIIHKIKDSQSPYIQKRQVFVKK